MIKACLFSHLLKIFFGLRASRSKETYFIKSCFFLPERFFQYFKINFLTVSLLFINIELKLDFSSCHLLSKEG